jgi:hypothetical protein
MKTDLLPTENEFDWKSYRCGDYSFGVQVDCSESLVSATMWDEAGGEWIPSVDIYPFAGEIVVEGRDGGTPFTLPELAALHALELIALELDLLPVDLSGHFERSLIEACKNLSTQERA